MNFLNERKLPLDVPVGAKKLMRISLIIRLNVSLVAFLYYSQGLIKKQDYSVYIVNIHGTFLLGISLVCMFSTPFIVT